MSIKLFLSVFGAVFIAELADKTQLVSMSMAAKHAKPVAVWFASVAAYMLVTVFSVALGSFLSKHVKPDVIRYGTAVVFIGLGLLIAFKKV